MSDVICGWCWHWLIKLRYLENECLREVGSILNSNVTHLGDDTRVFIDNWIYWTILHLVTTFHGSQSQTSVLSYLAWWRLPTAGVLFFPCSCLYRLATIYYPTDPQSERSPIIPYLRLLVHYIRSYALIVYPKATSFICSLWPSHVMTNKGYLL